MVSVNEKINDRASPPSGHHGRQKKEVTTLSLADIGVEADEVGLANAGSNRAVVDPKPPKTAGEKVADDGEGRQERSPSTSSRRRSSRRTPHLKEETHG